MSKPYLYLADDASEGFWASDLNSWTKDSRFEETFSYASLGPESRTQLLADANMRAQDGAVVHLVTDAQFVFESDSGLGGQRLAIEFVGIHERRAVIYSEEPRLQIRDARLMRLDRGTLRDGVRSHHDLAFRFLLEGFYLPAHELVDFLRRVVSIQHLFDPSGEVAHASRVAAVFAALAAGFGENTAPLFGRDTYEFFDDLVFELLAHALDPVRHLAARDWARMKRILHPYESLELASDIAPPFGSGGALRILSEFSRSEELANPDRATVARANGFFPRENEWIFRNMQHVRMRRASGLAPMSKREIATLIDAALSDLAFLGKIVDRLNEISKY